MKYLLFISYIGTAFKGVQKCKPFKVNNGMVEYDTICGSIEKAWDCTFNKRKIEPFRIFPSSRTDAGVHAIRSAVHVWLPEEKFPHKPIVTDTVTSCLNSFFKKQNIDIRVIQTLHVPETFDARRSAISRTYLYRFAVEISNESQRLIKVPITEQNRTYFLRCEEFDVDKVKEATKLFLGEKDHFALMGKPSHKPEWKPSIVTIQTLDFSLGKPFVPQYDPICENFTYYNVICTARSFLYRQVRRIVSLLIGVGQHKVSIDEIQTLFDTKDPSKWPGRTHMVPPHGLYLMKVDYRPEDLIIKDNISIEDSKIEVT